ncbi:EIIBCA-Man [Sebaldella termitidis]|jgi:PTS system fructose-specific IIB component|uniref:PTS system, fructose-specific, IIB subunnit n=1 Tax=Sebaldella termitidis (strain ATCC 33386 / NCTC 11300) TaxID=526218 RepID=D1APP9_SEBTE|nr:fructose PTS transporter subunit IIB [Sebaldella termitidis]ACZ10083.1 PTS system, fructose-specific, IIB subunnit [Sebaldella termitidis ATCC 33386]SUI25418.1 EIIBCA-Man [Sebaldella termitidis]
MKIVGVTSCIAGLAHTPMAAKALEKAGAKLGHDVRMEQQGAMGKVNEITESEIKSADLVLIAADKVVEDEDRFAGKQIVRVKIGQCVSNAEGVLKKIVEAMEKRK